MSLTEKTKIKKKPPALLKNIHSKVTSSTTWAQLLVSPSLLDTLHCFVLFNFSFILSYSNINIYFHLLTGNCGTISVILSCLFSQAPTLLNGWSVHLRELLCLNKKGHSLINIYLNGIQLGLIKSWWQLKCLQHCTK